MKEKSNIVIEVELPPPARKRIPSMPHRLLMLCFSALCHSIVVALLITVAGEPASFLLQLRKLTVISFAFSAVTCLLGSKSLFLCFHILRAATIALAVGLLHGTNVCVEILLILPLIAASTNRARHTGGLTISALTIVFAACADLVFLFHNVADALIHSAMILVTSAPMLLFAAWLSRAKVLIESSRKQIDVLKVSIENLSNANRAFQDYAEMIKPISMEEERNRITRELHDLIGYALTNIVMLMNAARILVSSSPDRLREMLEQARQQADSALQQSRQILYNLRAATGSEHVGLQALFQLVRVFSETTHLVVEFNYGNLPMSYGQPIDGVIYHVIQEGIINAIKNGKAQKITISLWQSEREISISVKDNGAGAETFTEGIGLKGMRERIAQLGGNLEAHGDSYGFSLLALIPANFDSFAKDKDDETD